MSDDLRFPIADTARFAGKTVGRAETVNSTDRTSALTLHFTDGTSAEIEWWASYADDGGLGVSWSEPTQGEGTP